VRLHYVGIRVTNLQRSLRFYTQVLGSRETVRGDFRKYGRGIRVGTHDPRSKVKLDINWYPPKSKYGSRYRPGDALDHGGFDIGSATSRKLGQVYERLLRAGARLTSVTPGSTGGRMACVQDPDGNWIEVVRMPTATERRAESRLTSRKPRRRPT
jgi:catechol 2,3-dioxygenase-like lactoylglutathione lyase family enzyme